MTTPKSGKFSYIAEFCAAILLRGCPKYFWLLYVERRRRGDCDNNYKIWAALWQNQHNDCALNEDSVQPGHPPSLIRVFAVLSLGS